MPGLVPGIYVLPHRSTDVDGRDKPGHDEQYHRTCYFALASGSIPLALIASTARGWLRNSISLFEAAVSFDPATAAAANTWTS
jgi:hypothetical protein